MKEHKRPSLLYNGMIAPLTPFRVRGVIWYQGESNRDHPEEYKTLFSTVIKNFRDVFEQPDMPFYFVQIAPFRYRNPSAKRAAWIRQAQVEVNKTVPNTAMVVTTDLVDDIKDIHPQIKKPVGHRLALCALAKTYGRDIVYSGPIYRSMETENSKVRIFFDHVNGGLTAKGKLSQFEIAGSDGTFYPAEARIEGETIVVQTDQVEDPRHVRFGFSNTAQPNLFNKAGLPASPFTTEDSTDAK
jgi:sialate O-acetylesterase